MQNTLIVVLLSMLFGCSLGVPIDRSGNAVCRSSGFVVFSGRLTMAGKSLLPDEELPQQWRLVGEDITCDIDFDHPEPAASL